ncbi:hypothetical protein FS837_008065 [Tulasnella sp. UAMH 9824]|nr:hypothetical protein FS837_008065 [Tulasnella sp. UAMH 9824]
MNADREISNATSAPKLVKCSNCRFTGHQNEFPRKVAGGYIKTCKACTKKAAEYRQQRKGQENSTSKEPQRASRVVDTGPMPWARFALKMARAKKEDCKIDEFVELPSSHLAADVTKGRVAQAAALVSDIRRVTGYSFNCHEKTGRTAGATVFEYFCSQYDGKQTKPKTYTTDPDASRDRDYMKRFPCGGSLRITIEDTQPLCPRIQFVHKKPHVPWVDIGPSEEIKAFIQQNKRMCSTQLWKEIQILWPETEMTESQVYNNWIKASESVWKLREDQVESARLLVEQAAGKEVELVALHSEPGMSALAFALKDPLERWGDETAEIAFDGTFNTNAAHYEISGLLAEGNGQGIPIGFIYTCGTDGTATRGAKMRLLVDFLKFFQERCPRIIFTLTDKERAKIDAFRKVWPDAKHQCCYWHAIRYLETRLAEDKLPGPYDPRNASKAFSFIDPTWAPGVVAKVEDAENDLESGSTRPRGESDEKEDLETTRAALSQTCRPPICILINGGKRIPIWPNPPCVKKKDLPRFCPKEFRAPIVEKFRRHFCLHPQIPLNDQDGTCLTAEEIYETAVYDMYQYCRQNNLAQVWAYLWTCWYASERWSLWARSASPVIPRLRTTMVAEGFWRLFKHDVLAAFSRPRLDLVTHLIITEVLPAMKRKLDHLCGLHRIGWPIAMVPWVKAVKGFWKDCTQPDSVRRKRKERKLLQTKPRTAAVKDHKEKQLEWLREEAENEHGGGQYCTSVENWTCSCPSFLTLRHHHTRPFYRMPGIHVVDTSKVLATLDDAVEIDHEVDAADLSETDDEPSSSSEDEGTSPNSPSLGDEGLPEDVIVDGARRVHFSSTEQDHHTENFNFITEKWLKNPRGLSPGLKRRLNQVLDSINGIVGEAREDEARRKRKRTWDAESGRTMFIANE